MSLTKEKIADWIYQMYQDDYFRFEYVSSGIEVTNFEQNENQLIVDYEFWDDGHANKGAPEFFYLILNYVKNTTFISLLICSS